MAAAITHGVRISVETFYQEEQSHPRQSEYLFAYRITIANESNHPIKLLSRHWHIFDSSGEHREVAGEGVVGRQPIIEPGDTYQYVSGCNLRTEMGKMYGTYTFQNRYNNSSFEAEIPEFIMIAPQKLN